MTGVESNDWYPYQKRTQSHKEGREKTEAEIGAMLPQAKENLEPPEGGRGKEEDSSAHAFGGNAALPTL